MKIKVFLLSTLILSACGLVPNKPVNVAMLQENVNLEQDSQYNPNEAHRVVVVGVEDSHGVSGISLGKHASAKLSQVMLEKGVNIVNVERSVRSQLTSEIQLIEAGGVSSFTLPDAANMATRGEIVSLNIVPSFTKASSYTNKKGEVIRTPAKCSYTVKLSGILVFYKVDPVAKYKSVRFDGKASQDIPGGSCPELSASQKRNLYSRAVDSGIDDADNKVANALARKGFVVSSYNDIDKKKTYYRLSINPNQGAIPGVGVQFIEIRKSPMNKMDEIPFGEGKVACTNHTDAAYAVVSDAAIIAKIKRNTPVKLKYKDDPIWIGMMKKMFPCNP